MRVHSLQLSVRQWIERATSCRIRRRKLEGEMLHLVQIQQPVGRNDCILVSFLPTT